MKEERPLLGYDYSFIGGINNSYYFKTVNQIFYEVKFKPTPYLFDSSFVFANDVFEMVIEVVDNETGRKLPLDKLIPFTIATVFKDFYRRCDRRITFYICESSDLRQEARRRKFDAWYYHFKEVDYMKVDAPIYDANDNMIYHNALIIKRANPYFLEIVDEFNKVSSGYSADK
jgi:hypothetical protein